MKCAALLVTGILAVSLRSFAGSAPAPAEYAPAVRVEALLITSTTSNGQPIVYPKTQNPEVRMLIVEIPPGRETGWHKHPNPAYGYILAGAVTVELEGGKASVFSAGQGFAETVNTLHNGKNTGTEPVKILMVVTGEVGAPVAEKK